MEPTQNLPRLSQRPSLRMLTAPPGNQQSSAHAWRKRTELFWRRPAFELCAHGVQTMNGRFECVDPIEHPLDRMPARNLAEDVVGVRDTCNFDHDGPSPD